MPEVPEDAAIEIDERRPEGRHLSGHRAPAASTSTRPTPRCASRTCRPGSWSPARTSGARSRTASGRWPCCAPSSSSAPRRSARPRWPACAGSTSRRAGGTRSAATSSSRTPWSRTCAPASRPRTRAPCWTATSTPFIEGYLRSRIGEAAAHVTDAMRRPYVAAPDRVEPVISMVDVGMTYPNGKVALTDVNVEHPRGRLRLPGRPVGRRQEHLHPAPHPRAAADHRARGGGRPRPVDDAAQPGAHRCGDGSGSSSRTSGCCPPRRSTRTSPSPWR